MKSKWAIGGSIAVVLLCACVGLVAVTGVIVVTRLQPTDSPSQLIAQSGTTTPAMAVSTKTAVPAAVPTMVPAKNAPMLPKITVVPPTRTSAPPTATATALPPTVAPTPTVPKVSVEITLFTQAPDWAKGKIGLSVVNGEYRVKSGATLLAGSQVYVYESDLPLSSGLGISVGKGGVTLQGTQYPEGTKLIADDSGRLIKIS